MKINYKWSLTNLFFLLAISFYSIAQTNQTEISVPKGFSVSVLAEDLGSPRHITVSKNGDIYVNRKKEKGLVLLKDNSGDGLIDERKVIGEEVGTGVLANDRYLYYSSNTSVYRYELDENFNLPAEQEPDKIVGGMIDMGRDNAKPFTMDGSDNLYVTIGSWNDPCRAENSGKGMMPCPMLKEAGGIWKFNGRILNQSLSTGSRYATGLKNAVALDWNTETNSLFTVVHGRGQFHDFYPQFYTAKQSAELPAEAMYELKKGDDAGWPYIYYDQKQEKKIVAPEYGGDGKRAGGEDAIDPIMAFPAHLGPNDLLFYTGDSFPKKYQNGAFVAFHGQSPELKKGYFVAFVPFKNGQPKGKWEIFADNFAGVDLANPSGPIQHRPCGLAIGNNGELYVTDDLNGTVFKIEYKK